MTPRIDLSRPRLPLWLQVLLALISAGLVRACLLPGAPAWLPFVALSPFALTLQNTTPRRGLFIGWLFGSACWLLCTWWTQSALIELLDWPSSAAWVGTIAFALWQGIPYALGGLLIGWLHQRGHKISVLFCVCLLTVLVAFRPSFYPGSMALLLAFWPQAIQVADLGGANLVLFLLLLINWSIAQGIMQFRTGRTGMAHLALALLLVSGMLGYGSWRITQYDAQAAAADAKDKLTATSVQPSLPLKGMEGLETSGPYIGQLGRLVKLTEQANATGNKTDIILWPEIPGNMTCECKDFKYSRVMLAAQTAEAPIMVACVEHDFGDNKPVTTISPDGRSSSTVQTIAAMYNALWRVDPNECCSPAYHKTILMPFGERTPLREVWPWIKKTFGRKLEYSPGPGAGIVELDKGLKIQPLLCLEAGYPDLTRQGVELGASAFAGLADELWFRSPLAAKFQLGSSIYRSVEFRRPMVRCTNSGLGAHIKATGALVPDTLTRFMDRTSVTATVHCPQTITPFARGGDAWLWLPGLFSVLCLTRGLRYGHLRS